MTYLVKMRVISKIRGEEKKIIPFKALSTKSKKVEESSDDEASSSGTIDDEEMALFVRQFGKLMNKKGFGRIRGRSSSRR